MKQVKKNSIKDDDEKNTNNIEYINKEEVNNCLISENILSTNIYIKSGRCELCTMQSPPLFYLKRNVLLIISI